MRRSAVPTLAAAALAALLGAAGCGSVTAKHSDGGGTGGSHADSSTKTDVAADREAEDARHDAPANHDSSSAKDMRMADARATDASSQGGSGGGGVGGGGGGECQSDADCMLYAGLGANCCGVCQAKSEPAPGTMECLIGCLTPLKSCTCVKNKCTGSNTLL